MYIVPNRETIKRRTAFTISEKCADYETFLILEKKKYISNHFRTQSTSTSSHPSGWKNEKKSTNIFL